MLKRSLVQSSHRKLACSVFAHLKFKCPFSTSWKWEHLSLWEKSLVSNSAEENNIAMSEPLRTSHQTTLKQQIPISIMKEHFAHLATKEKGTSFDDMLKIRAQEALHLGSEGQPLIEKIDSQDQQRGEVSMSIEQSYQQLKDIAKQRELSVSEFVALQNQKIRETKSKQTLQERLPTYADDLQLQFKYFSLEQLSEVLSQNIEIGGMSDGALSAQVHRHLTHAANKAGVLSNAGEGGVEEDRHNTIESPLVIQCASGRFGFDLTSLVEADEVQIKLAQGAKPGEGGHLPGSKVSLRIAGIRRARKGTTLISPQPQHDLYSIEDLYLLIHALKSVKPGMLVNVKLASDPEVAITALGAVKAGADRITIAGHNGGTGAAKISSIFNTGMPWEWGIATTHQMLDQYNLRDKIQLVASGGIVNGSDVVEAILLGADKVEVGTSALVSLGCIMLRKCHSPRSITPDQLIQPLTKIAAEKQVDAKTLARSVYDALCEAGYVEVASGAVNLDYQEIESINGQLNELELEEQLAEIVKTVLSNASGGCTVGLNTQDPLYLKKYEGTPEKAQDFLFMLALGALKHMKEQYNQTGSLLKLRGRAKEFLQSSGFFEDLNVLLGKIQLKAQKGYIDTLLQIPSPKDIEVISRIQSHISEQKGRNANNIPLNIEDLQLDQSDISFGAAISGYCQYHHLDFPIIIHLKSKSQVGPQNFGCFLRKNITLLIEGSCNDHVGKANSGGKIVVIQKENKLPVIVGNSIGFGATAGEMYIDGSSGTRSFVRNSGMQAVVTGNVNDHFCEFMTSGNVAVLGKVGRNCAAGMTGGYLFLNYELNKGNLKGKKFLSLEEDEEKQKIFKKLIENCFKETNSEIAKQVLDNWNQSLKQFKYHNPYNLNFLLDTNYLDQSKQSASYEIFASDHGVCESLSKLFNSDKRKTPFSFRFSGQTGKDFGSFLPSNVKILFSGFKVGNFAGYASKGTIAVFQKAEKGTNQLLKSFTGKFPFMRSSGSVFVKSDSQLGPNSFFQFKGTAVLCAPTGEESCQELQSSAKILVLGQVGHKFAKNSHLDSLVVVSKDQTKNLNEDSLTDLSDSDAIWTLEQISQMKRISSEIVLNEKHNENHGSLSVSSHLYNQMINVCTVEDVKRKFKKFIHEKNFFSYQDLREREETIKLAKNLLQIQQSAGWDTESLVCIESIAKSGLDEMTYSMGDQIDMEDRFMRMGPNTNFYGLFRQPFAQETRPPVDADSEGSFINTEIFIQSHRSAVESSDTYFKFEHPIISASTLASFVKSIDPIRVELRLDVCEIQVVLAAVEERIEEIVKQIRTEIVVGNKRAILFTHALDPTKEDEEKMHLDSWLVISLVRQRLREEGLSDYDIILETDEPISPHSLDVLMNICGVKLVQPRAVEKHLSVLASRYKDLRGARFSPSELWQNYAGGMQQALKRIIAKDGDVDLSTRVYSQTYTSLFLSKKLAHLVGIESFFSSPALNLEFISGIFQQRFMGTVEMTGSQTVSSQTELPRGNLFKSSKKFQHLWDSKRVDALQSLIHDKNESSFTKFFNLSGGVNIRRHFKKREHTKSAAIIGAGPAGLETAIMLSEQFPEVDEIVLFDSYFAPGGKIIDAVAPDHPITKRQLKNFSIFEHNRIRFVGNSYIDQRRMRDIYEQFSCVFLTHGATPRKLGDHIANSRECLVQADDLVRWYNSKTDMNAANTEGIPFYRTEQAHPPCPFNISETESVAIIGVGNVTIDIARILLRNPEEPILKDNITTYVYKQLQKSRVRFVSCIGRKPPTEAKFGMPELLEMKDLSLNEGLFTIIAQFDLQAATAEIEKVKSKLSKLKAQEISADKDSQTKENHEEQINELNSKIQLFEFFKQFHKTPEQVSDVRNHSSQKVVHFLFKEDIDPVKGFEKQPGTKKICANFISGGQIESDVFLASLGYQPHMPVSNILSINTSGQTGISLSKKKETPTYIVPNLFVAGQAKTGIGSIGHTKNDVKHLLKQFKPLDLQKKPSVEGFLEDHYYKQGAVSKEIVLQIMQSIRSHYTQKYITPSVIRKHVDNFRKIQYIESRNEKSSQSGSMSKSINSSHDSVNLTPRKIKVFSGIDDLEGKIVEIPVSDKSLRDCLSIKEGDCESGSCGGCYVFTSDPVESYESAEEKIAVSKGGLNKSTLPSGHKAILSCQHTPKDLVSDRITKLILTGGNRSSCGIGIHRGKEATHQFVESAVRHLKEDVARGAGVSGYGDGAGLLLKIDWEFFRKHGGFPESVLENFDQIKKSLAICSVFIREENDIQYIGEKLSTQGLAVIHIREVPIDSRKFVLGKARCHPKAYQFFVSAKQPNTLEKIIKKVQQNPRSIVPETDAMASISTNYVTYKLASFASEIDAFEDLNSSYGYKTDSILTHTRFATTTLQPNLVANTKTSAAVKAHPFQNLIHNGEIVTKRSIISYLEKHSELFKEQGILIDREELSNCSDSYVLQRYIKCLHSIYPQFSIADIIHMITRSTRYNSLLAEYARAKGMPQVCGPCNLALYDEELDQFILYRDNSGFRPAICISQEGQLHIVSQQQCQQSYDKVSLLSEGSIYIIKDSEKLIPYVPDDSKVPSKFHIKKLHA